MPRSKSSLSCDSTRTCTARRWTRSDSSIRNSRWAGTSSSTITGCPTVAPRRTTFAAEESSRTRSCRSTGRSPTGGERAKSRLVVFHARDALGHERVGEVPDGRQALELGRRKLDVELLLDAEED